MRAHLYTLIALVCLTAASAALDVTVTIDAPNTTLPGQAAEVNISATLAGVPIISFPATVTVLYPDGTQIPLELTNTMQGVYTATFYSTTEGTHTLTATVQLGEESFSATKVVSVQKPQARIDVHTTITGTALTGTISQDTPGEFTIETTPFATGDLNTKAYTNVCTIACDNECTFTCTVEPTAQILRFTTQKGYTYTTYLPAGTTQATTNVTYDRITGVNEPEPILLSTPAEVYTLFGTILNQVPIINGKYVFSPLAAGEGTIIVKDNQAITTLPLTVITRTNVQQFSPEQAADDTATWWYGYTTSDKETLLQLPADPGLHEAYFLRNGERTPLSWTKNYVVVPPGSGFVEVKREQPATRITNQTLLGFASIVGGAGVQRHEFPGRIQAFNTLLAQEQTYYNGSTSVVYTHDETLTIVTNAEGTLSLTQPLLTNTEATIQYDTTTTGAAQETTFSVYALNGALMQRQVFAGTQGTRTLILTLPPGGYFAVASGDTTAATGFYVLSENASIYLSTAQTLSANENTELTVTHSITNNDLARTRVIDLVADSKFVTIINGTDTNSNGLVDVTVGPGQTVPVVATVYIPLGAAQAELTINATSDELQASVTDTINVAIAPPITYVDTDIVSISGTQEAPVVEIQNNNEGNLVGTLYLNGPDLTTQLAVTLEPGMNKVHVPSTGKTLTARLQVVGDTIPQNNERTRYFSTPFSTRLVHINERLHVDHNQYTVQLPVTPGYTLVWIDNNGGEHQATAMQQDGSTLWNLGVVDANKEFYAALIPGEPQPEALNTIIDNNQQYVTKKGLWVEANTAPGYLGFDYYFDLNLEKTSAVIYAPPLTHDWYSVRVYSPADTSFAENAPVTIYGTTQATVLINQRRGGWQYLGLYELTPNSSVAISNFKTTQFVVADAVEFTPISQIGGLELIGNSTLDIETQVNKPIVIHTATYLDGTISVETQPAVRTELDGQSLTLIAQQEGTHTVVARDAERTLTITITATVPSLSYAFTAPIQTTDGVKQATLYTEEAYSALTQEGKLEELGNATGWVFDGEVVLNGKKITFERAYLPNYTLPITITPVTEEKSGRMFLFDAYEVSLNGLLANAVEVEDIADATALAQCARKGENKCKWTVIEPLVYKQTYTAQVTAPSVTYAEVSTVDAPTKKTGKKENRGIQWEKIEQGNKGTLHISATPKFYKRGAEYVDINTTVTLADGITSLEAPNAALQVKDNIFETAIKLSTGKDMLTLSDNTSKITISTPYEGKQGKAVENKIVYENVAQNVDLEYEIEAGILKEVYVIQSVDAPDTYTSTLTIDDVYVEQTPEHYLFRNKTTKEIVWAVWKPFAYDELGKNDTPGHRTTLESTLVEQGNEYTITVFMNKDWLNSAQRVFPVYIDPTLVSGSLNANDGGYVRTLEPAFFDDDMATGEFGSADQMANGFVRLNIGTLPANAIITDANLTLGIQENTGWDAGSDISYLSFLNSSLATTFWADNFREYTEYNQLATTNLYTFAQSTASAAGTYTFNLNSTGITGLQQILVNDRQSYVTVRSSYDPSQELDHQTSNEYVSWYTGINCCGVTGTPVTPQLDISYTFENDTPQLISPSFNQSAYNATQVIKFTVNITDLTSDIDEAAVVLQDPTSSTTNYSLTPAQTSTTISTTVSTTSTRLTAQNRSRTDFFDDVTYPNGANPAQFLWVEGGTDWSASGGRLTSDNAGGSASPDTITPAPNVGLLNQDKATITFDWETTSIEAPDCLTLELYNGTAWNTGIAFCTATTLGTWVQNITTSQYLHESFNFRFSNNGNALNDDVFVDNINMTSWRADKENASDWTQYGDVTSSTIRNATQFSFTVQVTGYNPGGSVSRGNTKPDLELEVFDGSTWSSLGTFNLYGTYTGSGVNTTARNFTITTTNSTIIDAWTDTKYKRDLRIRAVNLDYVGTSTKDEINYTRVYFNSTQTGGDAYEKTWVPTTLIGVGKYNATQIFANDTAGNTNVTNYNTLNFTLYSFASVSGKSSPGGLAVYPEDVNFSCHVQDTVFNIPIQGYNVTITSNVSGNLGEYNTDADGNVSVIHTINEQQRLTCIISNRTDLYYYTNASSDSRIIAVDVQAPQWTQWSLGIENGSNVSDGISVNRTNTTLQVRSYWTDDIGLDQAFVEHNGSGIFLNYTDADFVSGGDTAWSNYTFDFSDGGEFPYVGLINVSKAWMVDFVPNANSTSPSKYFYLYGKVNVTNIELDPASPAILQPTGFSCTVSDLYDIPAVGYNVNFYRNGALLGTAVTGTNGVATLNFTTAAIGTYTMECNITDAAGDYYSVSSPLNASTSMLVTPDTTAPSITSLVTNPTNAVLGEQVNISATLTDTAGITSADANITLPTGSVTSSSMSGSGTSYSTLYTTTLEGLHDIRVTATDPSANMNTSAYTHFIASGKAATNIRTAATQYNSNADVDITQRNIRATADLEAGTQSYSAPVTTTQITGIQIYFDSSGTCAGTTRNSGPASNSCRRGGYVDGAGKNWGAATIRSGWSGSNTISSNEIMGAYMFNISAIPDNAALTSGYMSITVNTETAWDNADNVLVYALPSASNSIWDANGPEQSVLQTQVLSPEFTVTTILGTQINGLPGNTITTALTQTQLDFIESHLSSDGLTIVLDSQAGTSEWVDFRSGFNGSSTATDPEIAFNYTTPTVDYNGTQINYTNVLATNEAELTAIRINVTVSGTDFRGSNASFTLGTGRMPVLRVNVYNGSAYKQKYACDILQRGVAANSTSGTCSITIRDSEFLTAWKTAANRDIQLQAMYLDNRNEGVDFINWTGVTAEIFNGSHLINTGASSLTGNVTLTVERDVSGTFVYNSTIYNASQTLAAGQLIDLASLWNATAWNVGDRAEGTYRAVVRLVNSTNQVVAQGDGTNVESTYTFTINDTVAPSITNSLPLNKSTLWGQNATGITFSFNSTDATGFTNCSLLVDNSIVNTTTAVSNGGSTTLAAYSIAQGTHLWHARCYDNATAKTMGYSQNFTLYIDNTAPSVNILTFNQSNFSSGTFNVTFNITDNNWTNLTWRAYIYSTLNTTNTTLNNTNTNFTLNNLAEGKHNITIEGTDGSYISTNKTITITVDLTAPYAKINTTNNTYYNVSNPQINITLIDNLSTTINYTMQVNGGNNATGTANNNTLTSVNLVQIPEGNHSIVARAVDQAGNTYSSVPIRIIVDLTAPVINLMTPAEGYSTNSTSVQFTWNYTDAFSPTANCSVFRNGTLNTTTIATNNTPTSVTVNNFAEGAWNWTVTCIDAAGNNGAASAVRNFTVDLTAPTVNLVSPANNTQYVTTRNASLTFNATDALNTLNACTLYVQSTLNQTMSSPAEDTNLAFNLTDLDNGVYTWQVRCNDTLGNTGSSLIRTFMVNVTVNAQAPSTNPLVDRDSVDATADVVALIANLSDNRSGATVVFKANLTAPAVGGQSNLVLGSNTSNSTGQAVLNFNPNSTLYAGTYTWWAEEARSLTNSTQTITVVGSVNLTYNSSTQGPESAYIASQNVNPVFVIASNGPESASELNASYTAKVEVNFTQPNGTLVAVNNATYNGSNNWNTSYTLTGTPEIGVWNITGYTNAAYFFVAANTTRNFSVIGLANAVSPANTTVLDRDAVDVTDPDSILLTIRVPGAQLPISVNFTANLTNPSIGGQTNIVLGTNTTNSTGYAVLYFNPANTMYAGNYTWYGTSPITVVNETRSFVVKGGLNTTFTNTTIDPNSTYFITDVFEARVNITSLGIESRDDLSTIYDIHPSGLFQQAYADLDSFPGFEYNSPTWNSSKDSYWSSVGLLGVIGINVSAPDRYFYSAYEAMRNVTINSKVNVTNNTNNPSTVVVYQPVTSTCTLTDELVGTIAPGVNVTFYRDGVYIGINSTDGSSQATLTHTINTTGTHTITCNVTDQPSIYYYRGSEPERNSTITVTPYGILPVSPANNSIVDRDSADATDPDYLLLNVSVPSSVPDGVRIDFYANLTAPSLGQTNVFLGNNTTSSGFAVLNFNPNSSIYAGNWRWYGNSSAGIANSTNTLIVKGTLVPAYNSSSYPNASFNQTDKAIIVVNITSPGPETRDELNSSYTITVNSTLYNTTNSATSQLLSYTNPYWNTSHSLSTHKGVGLWNNTVNASGTYWYSNFTNRSLTVYGYMNITGASLSQSTIYAFQSTTASCTVLDQLSNYVVNGATVSFYRAGALVGTNTTNASGVATYSFQTNTTGSHTVTCNITSQPGIYYYAGSEPERNTTLTVNTFGIDALSPVNGTIIDRDGASSDPDVILLNVSIPSFVPDGQRIEFRANLTNPSIAGNVDTFLGNNTTSGGYALLWFDANNSYYAGNWTWYGNHTAGLANSTRILTVKGEALVVFTNNTHNPNASYTAQQTILVDVNITTRGPETRDELNNTYLFGPEMYIGGIDSAHFNYTNPYWNAAYAVQTYMIQGGSPGPTNIVANTSYISAEHAFFYSNTTNRSTILYSEFNVFNSTLTASPIYAYQYTTAGCTITERYGGDLVQNANVSFYRNGTFLGTNLTNASGYANFAFQTNTTGTHTITCNITDQPSIYYYKGNDTEKNSTLTVLAFPVTPAGPANDTPVDRDETNASMTDVLMLNATVPAYIPDGVTIVFTANLTNPSIGGQTDLVLGSNTTSGGSVVLWYNPNSTYYAGNYTWWSTAASGETNGTRTYLAYGQLVLVYENTTYNPNQNYTQNSTATVNANLTSLGPETRAQLQGTYSAAVARTATNTTGSQTSAALSFTNPVWNGTLQFTLKGVGTWNISVNATANYFFNASTQRNTTVYGYMNVTSNSTTPTSITAFQATTTTCGVQDQHTSYAVSGATVSFYRNGVLVGTNTTNSTGIAALTHTINATGTYTLTCNVTDQPGIYYYKGAEPERNTTVTVNAFSIDALSPANGFIVDRDGTNATDPDYILLNVSVPSYVPDGQKIDFRANLTNPSIAGNGDLLLGNNTTSSGYAILYYNPNSTTYAGNWTWYGNHTAGIANSSRAFTSIGTPVLAFENDTYDPNSTYIYTDNITVHVNITSMGPESRAQFNAEYINPGYSTAVLGNIRDAGFVNGESIGLFVYNAPRWTSEYAGLRDLGVVGPYVIEVDTVMPYFYAEHTERNFTAFGLMNVSGNVTPSSLYAFQSTLVSCSANDEYNSQLVANANITFYRDGVLVGVNSTNSSGTATYAVQINTTGTHTITCNVTDQPGIYYYRGSEPEHNATVTVNPFSVMTVSPANDTPVDRDSVSTDADLVLLNASVPSFVPDGQVIVFYANLTNPSIGGQTDLVLGNNTTSGGFVVFNFNPNSSYYAGNYSWFANHSAGKENSTSTLLVKGGTALVFRNDTYTPSSAYNETDNISIEANLTSLGLETRNELNATYATHVFVNVTNPSNATDVANLTYQNPQWNTTYRLLTLAGIGNWTTKLYSTSQYFYDTNSSNRTFLVYGRSNVTGITLTPSTIYAYENTTVQCSVINGVTGTPVSGYNVTVLRNGTTVGLAQTNASGVATYSFQTNLSGTYAVNCTITDDVSKYLYALNTNVNTTLIVNKFPITPVNPVNDTLIDRDETQADPDVVVLNATVPSSIPDGVAVNFTANLTAPSIGGQTNLVLGTNTTSGGRVVLWYNPNSTYYAGNYTWWAEEPQGTVNGTRRHSVIGTYTNTYTSDALNPNSTYFINDTITTEINLTSSGPENRSLLNATYAAQVSASYMNSTQGSSSVGLVFNGTLWRNNTFTILTLKGVGVWNATANSSAQYFYTPALFNRTFTVYGYMNVTTNSSTPSTFYAYQATTSSCGVQNQHSNYAVSGATVNFYRDGTLIGTNTTNTTGVATLTHTINVTGTHTITCNVTDQPGIYYYRGAEPERNTTVTVLAFPVMTVTPTNGSIVDRDSADAADPDMLELNLTVPSYVPDGVVVDVRANITEPSIAGQTNVLLGSNTTSANKVTVWFNPGSAFYAGNWTWFGNSSSGTPNSTQYFVAKGTLVPVYTNTTYNPNATYNITQTALIDANVTTPGPETRDELNSSYSIGVQSTVTNTTGSTTSALMAYANQHWSASHALSTLFGVGTWNSTVNTSGKYWYSNATNRTFAVYSFMNITSNTTTPDTQYVYEYTTTSCTVQDEITQYAVSGATVGFYRNATLVGTNTTNTAGLAVLSFQTNNSGTYVVTCNVTDQQGIYYYHGSEPSRNTTLTVYAYPITAANPANDTLIDRDEMNGGVSDVILLNASVPAYVPDGEVLTFYANLTNPSIGGQTDLILGSNTTSSGYALLWYNANSSFYAGNYSWFARSAEGNPNNTRTYLVYGQLNTTFANNTLEPDANYTQNQSAYALINVTSLALETRDSLNTTYAAAANMTLTAPNGTLGFENLTYTSPYWNGSFALLSVAGTPGVWNISSAAQATYFFNSTSVTRNFTVFGYMNVTAIAVTPNPIDAYNTANYTCTVRNEFTTEPVIGANVSFYHEAVLMGTALTNASGVASILYIESTQGLFNVTCAVGDQLDIYYYAGDEWNLTTTLNVTPILLTPVSPAVDTLIDRDEIGAGAAEVLLVGQVLSTVPDGISIDFFANLTEPAIAGQSNIYLGSNSTNGSFINLTFNPNSSFYAGNYTWWMNSSGGVPNGSRSVLVVGAVNVTYASESDAPRLEYNETDNATFVLNVTSNGPETRFDLNGTYNGSVNLTLVSPQNGTQLKVALFNGSTWNATQNLFGFGVGVWNTSVVYDAKYFFAQVHQLRNYTEWGFMYVTAFDNEEVFNGSVYAGVPGHFYVFLTNTFGEPLENATCIAAFYDRNMTFSYNPSIYMYENSSAFDVEALLRYNVTCTKDFYNTNSGLGNVTIHSSVNTTLMTTVSELAAGVREVSMNVTNRQNYTEHDVFVYNYIPQGLTASYLTVPIDSSLVRGDNFVGNSTRWYIPNITAGQSTVIRYNLTGSVNITDMHQGALQVYSTNTSVILG